MPRRKTRICRPAAPRPKKLVKNALTSAAPPLPKKARPAKNAPAKAKQKRRRKTPKPIFLQLTADAFRVGRFLLWLRLGADQCREFVQRRSELNGVKVRQRLNLFEQSIE